MITSSAQGYALAGNQNMKWSKTRVHACWPGMHESQVVSLTTVLLACVFRIFTNKTNLYFSYNKLSIPPYLFHASSIFARRCPYLQASNSTRIEGNLGDHSFHFPDVKNWNPKELIKPSIFINVHLKQSRIGMLNFWIQALSVKPHRIKKWLGEKKQLGKCSDMLEAPLRTQPQREAETSRATPESDLNTQPLWQPLLCCISSNNYFNSSVADDLWLLTEWVIGD